MKTIKNILLYVWQLPQNLLGLLLFAVYKNGSKDVSYKDAIIRFNPRFRSGISLGRYIVLKHDGKWLKEHEYGHCRQSKRWGWLYLPIPGLVSLLHNMYCVCENHKHGSYHNIWPENEADRLGGVVRNTSLVILCFVLSSCCPKITPVSSDKKDSVRVVHETEYVERWRDSVVYVDVPVETKQQAKRDSSHLETSLAMSNAWIDSLGFLNHTLRHKTQKIEVPVKVKDAALTERKDSIIYRDHYVKEMVEVKHIPKSYWWLLVVSIISVGVNVMLVRKR